MFFIHSFVCFVITAIVLEDLKKKEPQNVAPQLGNVNNLVAQVAHSFFINFVLPLTSNATCHIYHTIAHILFIYLLTPHFSNLSQLYTSLSHTISCTSPPIHPFISNKLPHTPSLTIKPSYQPSYTISNIPPPRQADVFLMWTNNVSVKCCKNLKLLSDFVCSISQSMTKSIKVGGCYLATWQQSDHIFITSSLPPSNHISLHSITSTFTYHHRKDHLRN